MTAKNNIIKNAVIREFSDLATAQAFAERCIKIHMVVLGDNGKYWVMLPKYSEQLIKAGFEYAK